MRFYRNTVLALLLAITMPTYAVLNVTPNPLPTVTFNAWGGFTGDFVSITDFCIISTRGGGNRRRNYDAAAYQVSPGGTTGFIIENGGTGHQLNITFDFLDTSGALHNMTNYAVTGFITPLIQGPRNCTEGAAQLILTLPSTELAIAQPGIYSATLGFDVLQQNGTYTGVMQFLVNMPELVELSGLEDVSMVGPVGQPIVGVEDFCVFRNGSGGFSVTVSGSNDSGGNYYVKDVLSVPYQVEVGQGGSFSTLLPGVVVPSSSSGFSGMSVRDCGGATNTQIRLTIADGDASAVPYGIYSDTLVVMIAPD